jgi:hypothetical protein
MVLVLVLSQALDTNLKLYRERRMVNTTQTPLQEPEAHSQPNHTPNLLNDLPSHQESAMEKRGKRATRPRANTQLTAQPTFAHSIHPDLTLGGKEMEGCLQTASELEKEDCSKLSHSEEEASFWVNLSKKQEDDDLTVEFSARCPKLGMDPIELLKIK